MADETAADERVITGAYEERVRELFRVFAEGVATGEPDRDGVVRFKRNLLTAKRVRDLALQAARELANE